MSPRACAGILRRAERRGRELPTQLGAALRRRAEPHLRELAAMEEEERLRALEEDEAMAEAEVPPESPSPSPPEATTPPSPDAGSKTTTTSSWETPTLLEEPSLF